jgi:hypothetical protein
MRYTAVPAGEYLVQVRLVEQAGRTRTLDHEKFQVTP